MRRNHSARGRKIQTRRVSRARQVERLEERRLFNVVFNPVFGTETLQESAPFKVLNSPTFHLLLWGSHWGTGPGQFDPAPVISEAKAILNSSYLSGLSEYGITNTAPASIDSYVDSASDPTSGFNPGNLVGSSLTEAHTEFTSVVTAGNLPGPGNPADLEHAPIYVVIEDPTDSPTNGGYNTTGTVSGKNVNIFSLGTDSSFGNYGDTFSHETAERMSDVENGGVTLKLPGVVPTAVGNGNDLVQIGDGEAEPGGQNHYSYRIGGPTSQAIVQPFYSVAFGAFIAPDGNSERFDLAPRWTIGSSNNDTFNNNYDLTINGDQLPGKDDSIVISRDSAGGTQVTLDGQTAWFDPSSGNFQGTALNSININGLTGNNTITIDYSNGNPIPGGGLTINGGSGNDTLIATGQANTWVINGTNSGTLNGITFSNIQNLKGGAQSDDFQFASGGNVTGNIDGGAGGTNTLDYSTLAGPVSVNLQSQTATDIGGTFSNINALAGSTGTADNLTGPDASSTWTLSGANSGTVAGVAFTSFENLNGGAGNDTFAFQPGGSVSGNLNGGGGTNTLDYSALAGPITVNLSSGVVAPDVAGLIQNVTSFVGSAGLDTLVGPATSSIYTVTGANAGTVGAYTFSSFENLTGGPANDVFVFQPGGSLAGGIDGGGGTNTLDYSFYGGPVSVNLATGAATGIGTSLTNLSNFLGSGSNADTLGGPAGDATWSITGTNAGSVNGNTFSSFENLAGGAGNDTFAFTTGGSVSGNIDGGAGTNTLDYSALAGPVTVNLQTAKASDIGGTFANVSNFVGSLGSDSLTGPDAATQWNITAANSGTVGPDTFSSFENLVGGLGNDTFSIYNGGSISGSIDGGGGTNTLDYSHFTGNIIVNLALGTATGVAGRIFNIEGIVGGAGNNLFVGNAANNLFVGGTGRNILIGGGGSDTLIGGGGDSLLIGGSTAYDTNATALSAIFAEWTRSDLSFEQRIADLISPGSQPRSLNGSYTLDKKNVFDDNAPDTLQSGPGLTWAFVTKKQDTFSSRSPRDHVTEV